MSTSDFLLLMHAGPQTDPKAWGPYLQRLRETGRMQGGSSIGAGAPPAVTEQLSGYIKVRAADLADAQTLLVGQPVDEAGGVVEIRHLPTD
ncbi:MAG: hypothetical protein JNM17_07625 [Archangium sp.]|nr:hypothetical protein [Archangium sp.]